MKNSIVNKEVKEIVIVCFGTPNISGDALGPQVGSYLISKYKVKAFVYGTIENPINGKNMGEWMSFINQVHKDSVIVAVDASLGREDKIGHIMVREDGVCPAAVKGEKLRYGDVGILAVVGKNTGDALAELMQVPYVYVSKIADKVAFMIKECVNKAYYA